VQNLVASVYRLNWPNPLKQPKQPKQAQQAIVFYSVALLSVLLLSSCALLKPPPDDTKGVRDWLVVPVFYATNRAAGTSGALIDYSETENGKGLTFGVKNVAVPLPIYSPVDHDTELKMRWQRIRKDDVSKSGPPEFDAAKCEIPDATFTREQVVENFNSHRKASGSGRTVIFVHGCCANFDTSMKRAARLSAHMQVPVLAYDWMSPPGFTAYLKNETLARQSLDDFCRFLGRAEKVLNPGNMTILGHSMGAIFVDEAMVRRSGQSMISATTPPRFAELIMSNADVDAQTFLNHASQFDANAAKSRVYFSTDDSRLNASAMAHGGFKRLGEPGLLIEDLAKIKGLELIDITANNTGHELPFWIIANMHKFGNLGPVKEYQLQAEAPNLQKLVMMGAPTKQAAKASADCHVE
jgi:esterase/lipase superfamily enzyme